MPDPEGLARRTVAKDNEQGDFAAIYCEVWVHMSEDAEEIAGMRCGVIVSRGHVTRIELR